MAFLSWSERLSLCRRAAAMKFLLVLRLGRREAFDHPKRLFGLRGDSFTGLRRGFPIPLILYILNWMGLLEKSQLTPYRRLIYFVCFIVPALFTPDVVGQISLALSTIVLFELFFTRDAVFAGGLTA